jgi:VanZ family protein
MVINGRAESAPPRESSPALEGRVRTLVRIAWLLVPPFATMAAIFLFSAQPSDSPDREWWEIDLRKLAHVIEYAVLAVLWWRAIAGLWGPRRALVAAVTISIAYACTDEMHQTFVEGRRGTPVDVLIDAVGVTIACVAVRAYARRRRTAGPSRPRAA